MYDCCAGINVVVPLLTDVTSNKGDHQLFRLAALTARLGDNMLVKQLYSSLEAGELHHGVGDLSHPQRHHPLVEAGVEGGRRHVSLMGRH